MKRFLGLIVGFLFLALEIQTFAQQQDMCRTFRLEAEVPANALHAEGMIPVHVKMTNIGDKDFLIDSWSRNWLQLHLVARDAQGRDIPYSEEYRKVLYEAEHAAITANVSTPIAAGDSIDYSLFLDKLFDLNPGENYSLAVARWCGNPNQQLKANTIGFSTNPSNPMSASKQSSISIHLTTPETEYPLGWAVPVKISLQNHGGMPVQWAAPQVWSELPDEYAMGVEIHDASGSVLTAVPEAIAPWKTHHYPSAGVGFIQIPAHGLAETNIALGNLYDLGKPGKLSARIVLVDATTNQRVESNTIEFTLRSPDHLSGLKQKRAIPPFMMNISYVPYPQNDGHIDPSSAAILMCNVSDHEIWMYNASGNYAEVLGPGNKAVPMTDAETKLWKKYNDPAISTVLNHEHPTSNNWFQLAPHQAIQFGVMTYEKRYNLSYSGNYRLRIYRYDDPDAEEGTKLAGLPIVYSNWMNFEVPARPDKP